MLPPRRRPTVGGFLLDVTRSDYSGGMRAEGCTRALEAWQTGETLETLEVLRPALQGTELFAAEDLPAAALGCAALLRVGDTAQARALLKRWPTEVHGAARKTVLLARAAFLEDMQDTAQAQLARVQAQQEGDVGAFMGAVTLLGELSLLAEPLPEGRVRGFAALHILAQGLRVAEQTGSEADAHLLSVLAAAQRYAGPRKAQQTALKALERSVAGSPARVGSLLLLGRAEAARAEQEKSQLAAGWLRVFELQ